MYILLTVQNSTSSRPVCMSY